MFKDRGSHAHTDRIAWEELSNLTQIPRDALRRALSHDLDAPLPILLSVQDSQIAIGQAMQEAMTSQGLTVYQLHEMTGLSCDFVEDMANGEGDLSDSEPLSQLQQALKIRLTHL